ncbi:MAG: hypothetical protein K2L11_03645, partial [Muribaculaceae bacterium]|nr:hypothetical protein [Muribaculaceae bacterium]
RYGYKFNEAQEKILKYGTEAERAAIIAEVVGESVGGMNKKLAETDTGKMKQLENYVGDLKEQIGGMFKKADPFIAMAANSATAFIGLQKLRSGVLALVKSMNMLKLAGGAVGLAIAAIAAAYVYFTSNTDKATQAMKEFTDAKKQQEREEQHAKEIIEAEDEARKSAIASLELNKAKIENFKGSKAEERKLVKELNDTYGRTMGYFKSLSEWYQALEKNSDAYCQQLVKEAKARKLADQVADLELKRDDISEKQETVSKEKKKRAVYIPGSLGQVDHYEEDPSEYEKLEAAKNNIDIEIERKKRAIREAEIPVVMPVMGSTTEPELGGGGGGSSTPKTRLQEIDAAIKSNEEKWRSASEAEKSAILSTVNALREEKRAIELHQAELSRPLELKSIQDFNDEISYQQKLLASASKENAASIQQTIDALELQREALSVPAELKSIDDYNKALSYQQKLRSMASAEEIAQHDQVIKQLTEERDAMERAAHVAIDADKITSYRQLQDEISYYTDLLQNGTEKEKRFATENLPALMKKEKAMGIQNAGIGIATDPAQANTLDEVGAAISLLEQKIQNASADEIDALQRSKMAFEEKKKVLERGIEIPQMQKEIADIMGLSDAEMTIKIRDIGFDTLAERIKEIQSMLNDLDNPPTEGQRQALEEVMGVYEQWKEKCVDSKEVLVSTLNQASSAFSGLGDAFEMPELNVVGIIAGAVATMIQGFASASAQSSSMGPWGWAAFSLAGLAQLAAMVSQIKGMGAFAEGGIVSGPTLGLVGEYAGAKNNPEVIAPLNRLKDLIGNDENGANG